MHIAHIYVIKCKFLVTHAGGVLSAAVKKITLDHVQLRLQSLNSVKLCITIHSINEHVRSSNFREVHDLG